MLPRRPLLAALRRALRHDGGIGHQPLAMECGLDQAALTFVEVALAGEQSLAQQHSRALEHAALLELRLVCDQNVPDRIGMIDEIHVLRSQAQINQIAELARASLQKFRGVLPKLAQYAKEGAGFGTRGTSRGGWHSLLL